jgi:hypothetical protein
MVAQYHQSRLIVELYVCRRPFAPDVNEELAEEQSFLDCRGASDKFRLTCAGGYGPLAFAQPCHSSTAEKEHIAGGATLGDTVTTVVRVRVPMRTCS